MAKKVWYVGHVDAGVILSNDHWKQRVGEDKPALAFNTSTGFSQDASALSARQLQWFESQSDFYVVETELTARAASAVSPLESTYTGGGGGGGGGVVTPVPASGGIVITDTATVDTPTPVGAAINQAVTQPTTVTDSVKPSGAPVLV